MTITQDRIARVLEVFEHNFTDRDELGASVSIWQHGNEILSRSAGWCERERIRPWSATTLVPFWSATKGPASACVLNALDAAAIALGEKVAVVWPEFAAAGKEDITIAELLSHRAGLAALDHEVSSFDYRAVIRALERQAPNWPPGTAHGYHPRTFGFLLEEIIRRVSDARSLGDYWRVIFAEPLDLDLWIGLPDEQSDRVAKLYAGKMADTPGEEAFYRAFGDPRSLTRRAFASPAGITALTGMNGPDARREGFASMGGIGTAASLAKFYAMLAGGGRWRGRTYLGSDVLAQVETTLSSGLDKTFQLQTAFAGGFMKDPVDAFGEKRRALFGPEKRAFGHPGAGGSHAFADPENGIAFAYTMNQMSYGVLPNARSLEMVEALYA